jgi:lipid A 3-O-deacylase PagL
MLLSMKCRFLSSVFLALGLLGAPSYGDDLSRDLPRLDAGQVRFDLQARDEQPPDEPPQFGLAGETRLTIGTGIAIEFEDDDDSTDFNLNIAWSRFIVDDWEFRVELGGWYFDQSPDATWGVNPNMIIRWHFINEDPWTVYADVGLGLLFAADDVPSGGSSVDFMPRAGVGVTHRINMKGDRVEVGLRWHHVSNARVVGDANNPDRDGLMLYAGFSFSL